MRPCLRGSLTAARTDTKQMLGLDDLSPISAANTAARTGHAHRVWRPGLPDKGQVLRSAIFHHCIVSQVVEYCGGFCYTFYPWVLCLWRFSPPTETGGSAVGWMRKI